MATALPSSWLLVVLALVAVVPPGEGDCTASDQALALGKTKVCSSLVQGPTPWCGTLYKNITAKEDWPSQAVYMHDLIAQLSATSPDCVQTAVAHDVVRWLNTSQAEPAVSGSWMWTFLVFQTQYYEQPRLPGDRLESPATLGRKGWAFAFLAQGWADTAAALEKAVSSAGLGPNSVSRFTEAYNKAIPLTKALCEKELHSCFVNATPVPGKVSKCPDLVLEFKAGFERENALRAFDTHYPF